MEEEMQGLENKIAELEAEKKSKQAEIKMLQQAKDSESGGEMKELEEEAAEISKGLVKATSAWQHSKENLGTDSQKKSMHTHTQTHLQTYILTHTYILHAHIYTYLDFMKSKIIGTDF
jgi:wobble nucleotide-excising tRNase